MNLIEKPTAYLDTLPAAIVASERRGQSLLVSSTLLPTDMRGQRAAFEAMGITFGDVVKGDPLFINATLPDGWKKVGTDHAMWSELVDAKGRKRAMIFYKAAFYDRRANMHAEKRYSFSSYEERDGAAQIGRVRDANGTVLFETKPTKVGREDKSYEVHEKLDAQCITWLDERFPQWRDVGAYWD